MAKEFNAHIVAAFLEEMVYHARPDSEEDLCTVTDWKMDTVIQKEKHLRTASKEKVQTRFETEGVHFNIRTDKLPVRHIYSI